MQNFLMLHFNTVILYIGAIDAAAIIGLGIAGAAIYLFDLQAKAFFDRILPATGILIGTSVAAGIIMLIARWISGMFG